MPMPAIIPPNAVGFYVLIRPKRFWNSAFLDRGYEELGAKVVRETPVRRDTLLKTALEMILLSIERGIDPAIRQLPLEHPRRQEWLHMNRIGSATYAYLMDSKFFVLVQTDGQCRFEKVTATTIPEAQQIISQRPDIRVIERAAVVAWEPTTVH
jgi:hypothetical protein